MGGVRGRQAAFWLAPVLCLLTMGSSAVAQSGPGTPAAIPTSAGADQTATPPDAPTGAKTEVIPGNGGLLGSPGHHKPIEVNSQGDITLNFVNADVRDVVKTVLGDYLKLNYEVGSNVQGTVTLQTSQPLSHAQVLPALEQALSLNGLALVESSGIYEVMPIADAHRQTSAATPTTTQGGGKLGYGVEVVRVKYLSAVEMQKLLVPLAASEGAVRVDPARNLLILEGTEEERETLLDDIELFDADWLSGMSFALYQPNYMDAGELAKELDQILGGMNSPIAGVVRLVPIDRLNAVLAISPQQRYLTQLQAWVNRLDRPGQGNDKKIFVYHVQNGRAPDIANTLLKTLFGSSAGQSSTDTSPSSSTLTPSSQSSSISSGGLSSGGSTPFGGSTGGSTTTTTHSTAPASVFQPTSTPAQEGSSRSRGVYETIEGVGREGLSSVNITADETNNALVILATPREYAVIENALHQLDVAPVQVLLEASIAEVTLTNQTQFGFQYFYQQPNGTNQVVLSNGASSAIAASFPGFSYLFTKGTSIQVMLNALGSITNVNVISSPEVLVLNNQTASLEVGDQVPVLTSTAVSVETPGAPEVNTVEYVDTGIILKVTPRVNRSGQVMMDISQEVSEVDNSASSAIGSPTIQERKINSSVSVGDSETIALGGLFTEEVDKDYSGIPYLQDIPYLGHLFRTDNNTHNKTELMVLITPHVVDDVRKARAVTDELRRELPDVQPLFKKAH